MAADFCILEAIGLLPCAVRWPGWLVGAHGSIGKND
jgi:hypothetical protein